jgi:hypothetical protein
MSRVDKLRLEIARLRAMESEARRAIERDKAEIRRIEAEMVELALSLGDQVIDISDPSDS